MTTPKHTHIVSSTPSRTRLRVSQKRRTPQEMKRIANALNASSDVHEVRTNHQTGSIVIHHASDSNSLDNIVATLNDLGVILGSIADVKLPSLEGKSEVASNVTAAVADLNQRVGQATNGIIDLRMIIPIGFGALALRQLLREGLQIEAAPWYALAYYAFDSFIKLHYTQEPSTDETKS